MTTEQDRQPNHSGHDGVFDADGSFDAEGVLDALGDACYVLDHEWRFLYLNSRAERLVRRTREELLGRRVWDEFSEAEDAGFGRQYRRAVAERVPVTIEEYYPPLDIWFDVRAFPCASGLVVLFQDITERKRGAETLRASEEARGESEERLRDTQARLAAALEAGGIATWTYDLAADRVVADANLARLFSVSPEDAAGGRLEVYLQAIHPDDRPRIPEAIADAEAHREVYEAEYRVVLPDGSPRWLATRGRVERDPQGQATALPGVVLDITERAQRRLRERFLADLTERAQRLTDPEEVIADAVRSVGKFLGLSRCALAEIDLGADTCTVPFDYCANQTVASIAGVFPISGFGPSLVAGFQAGRAVVVDDVRNDPVLVSEGASRRMTPSTSALTSPSPSCIPPARSPASRATAPRRGAGSPRRWNWPAPWWSGRG